MTLRRTILPILLLATLASALAATVSAGPKVLRSSVWNGHRYVVCQRDDGSRVEIKGGPKMSDAEALAKVPAVEPAPEAPTKVLADYTDAEIITETKRRNLTASDLGFAEAIVREVPK